MRVLGHRSKAKLLGTGEECFEILVKVLKPFQGGSKYLAFWSWCSMIVKLYGPNCAKVSSTGSNLVRELLYLRLCCGHAVLAWLDLGDQDLHVRGDDQGAAEVEERGGLQGED